jgi:hypothetical protein
MQNNNLPQPMDDSQPEMAQNPMLNEGAVNEVGYSFWMVWGNTCEGNLRWHMVRTPADWDEEQVRERAESYARGGCGDDYCSIDHIEYGYDDGIWNDYCE